MAVKIRRTGDVSNNGYKCLVYGKAGVGKTKLLGTAPRPIVLSKESGLLSLRKENIPYIEVETVEDIYEAMEYLMSSKGKKFDTIGLDSISEMAEIVLADHKAKEKNLMQAYGKMADEMLELIRTFRDIKGKNVVFIAKQQRASDEDTGLTQYLPSMPGQVLTKELPFLFDEVFFMTFYEKSNGNKIRVLRTETSLEHDGKDRSGTLKKLELPNLTKVFNKISKGETNG